MQVKRISDLIKEGQIQVIDKEKGFTVRDLTAGYMKDSDDGYTTDSVFGFDGKLNIRPSYQRKTASLEIMALLFFVHFPRKKIKHTFFSHTP